MVVWRAPLSSSLTLFGLQNRNGHTMICIMLRLCLAHLRTLESPLLLVLLLKGPHPPLGTTAVCTWRAWADYPFLEASFEYFSLGANLNDL